MVKQPVMREDGPKKEESANTGTISRSGFGQGKVPVAAAASEEKKEEPMRRPTFTNTRAAKKPEEDNFVLTRGDMGSGVVVPKEESKTGLPARDAPRRTEEKKEGGGFGAEWRGSAPTGGSRGGSAAGGAP